MEARESTFEKDTPMGHPQTHGFVGLFVPVLGSDIDMPGNIRDGAGIIGFGNPNGTLTIYFENNRFGDSSLDKWEKKVLAAYRRMIDHLPTTSKAVVQPTQLQLVGTMAADGLRLTRFDGLQRWLDHSKLPDSAPESHEISFDR
jgi:hypothetical protein